jgi:hypothetical protein
MVTVGLEFLMTVTEEYSLLGCDITWFGDTTNILGECTVLAFRRS